MGVLAPSAGVASPPNPECATNPPLRLDDRTQVSLGSVANHASSLPTFSQFLSVTPLPEQRCSDNLTFQENRMDDFQWYATTPALAQRAWATFKNRDFSLVLDSSAGNGDLGDHSPWAEDPYGHRGHTPRIDCCEIDISRHPTLRAKNFNVIGFDFLQMQSAVHYRHIIMNAPFNEGARHVLKAWDLMFDGEIVAIINAETVRNPFSEERKRLAKLINEHGGVEFIANAFSGPDAQRKTDVEVALVYLCKKADTSSIVGDLFKDLREDAANAQTLAQDYQEQCEVALPNSMIENTVLAFAAAVRSMRDSVFSRARANYYSSILGETFAVRNGDRENATAEVSASWVQNTMAEEYDTLKDAAWAGILRSSNVTSRLSSKAQQRVESEFENIKKLEFTVSNIYGFLLGIIESQSQIQIEMMCDVFDEITKYWSDNTHYYRGWRSNDKHRTCGMKIKATRFVLPRHGAGCWSHNFSWETERLLSDFDRVFALVDGKREPAVSLLSVARQRFDDLRRGERVSSSYFDLRFYRGIGTLHFFPKSKKLIDRFNRIVGAHRRWLPNETERVSKDFWLQFDQADKFDKELRNEIACGPKVGWRGNPLQAMHFRSNSDSGDQSLALVEAALDTVLKRHGLSVEFQLEAPEQAALPLLAA